MNFSKGLLEASSARHPSSLLVLPVGGVGWSDLGSEKQVAAVVGRRDEAGRTRRNLTAAFEAKMPRGFVMAEKKPATRTGKNPGGAEDPVKSTRKRSLRKTEVEPPVGEVDLSQRIAEKAYELFEGRNRAHGHELEDWLEAERMVLAELGADPHPTTKGRRGISRKG